MPCRRLRVQLRALARTGLLLASGCGDGTGPQDQALSIDAFMAGPGVVCRARSSTIAARISGADPSRLSYSWQASGGEIDGWGPMVAWNAPDEAGKYKVYLTVTGRRGATAADSLEVEVREGTVLVATPQVGRIVAVDPAGNAWTFADDVWQGSHSLEVFGERIFILCPEHHLCELDPLSGNVISLLPIVAPSLTELSAFVALPEGKFALLSNMQDMLWIADSTGHAQERLAFGSQTSSEPLQSMDGAYEGIWLHLCCTDDRDLMDVDLREQATGTTDQTFGLSGRWIRSIDFGDGRMYYGESTTVFEQTSDGALRELFSTGDEYHVTSMTVAGPYLYSTVNFAGKVYRTERATGNTTLFAEGLELPEDIECLPMSLAPGGLH